MSTFGTNDAGNQFYMLSMPDKSLPNPHSREMIKGRTAWCGKFITLFDVQYARSWKDARDLLVPSHQLTGWQLKAVTCPFDRRYDERFAIEAVLGWYKRDEQQRKLGKGLRQPVELEIEEPRATAKMFEETNPKRSRAEQPLPEVTESNDEEW